MPKKKVLTKKEAKQDAKKEASLQVAASLEEARLRKETALLEASNLKVRYDLMKEENRLKKMVEVKEAVPGEDVLSNVEEQPPPRNNRRMMDTREKRVGLEGLYYVNFICPHDANRNESFVFYADSDQFAQKVARGMRIEGQKEILGLYYFTDEEKLRKIELQYPPECPPFDITNDLKSKIALQRVGTMSVPNVLHLPLTRSLKKMKE